MRVRQPTLKPHSHSVHLRNYVTLDLSYELRRLIEESLPFWCGRGERPVTPLTARDPADRCRDLFGGIF